MQKEFEAKILNKYVNVYGDFESVDSSTVAIRYTIEFEMRDWGIHSVSVFINNVDGSLFVEKDEDAQQEEIILTMEGWQSDTSELRFQNDGAFFITELVIDFETKTYHFN